MEVGPILGAAVACFFPTADNNQGRPDGRTARTVAERLYKCALWDLGLVVFEISSGELVNPADTVYASIEFQTMS